jgi:hypothetical protein
VGALSITEHDGSALLSDQRIQPIRIQALSITEGASFEACAKNSFGRRRANHHETMVVKDNLEALDRTTNFGCERNVI